MTKKYLYKSTLLLICSFMSMMSAQEVNPAKDMHSIAQALHLENNGLFTALTQLASALGVFDIPQVQESLPTIANQIASMSGDNKSELSELANMFSTLTSAFKPTSKPIPTLHTLAKHRVKKLILEEKISLSVVEELPIELYFSLLTECIMHWKELTSHQKVLFTKSLFFHRYITLLEKQKFIFTLLGTSIVSVQDTNDIIRHFHSHVASLNNQDLVTQWTALLDFFSRFFILNQSELPIAHLTKAVDGFQRLCSTDEMLDKKNHRHLLSSMIEKAFEENNIPVCKTLCQLIQSLITLDENILDVLPVSLFQKAIRKSYEFFLFLAEYCFPYIQRLPYPKQKMWSTILYSEVYSNARKPEYSAMFTALTHYVKPSLRFIMTILHDEKTTRWLLENKLVDLPTLVTMRAEDDKAIMAPFLEENNLPNTLAVTTATEMNWFFYQFFMQPQLSSNVLACWAPYLEQISPLLPKPYQKDILIISFLNNYEPVLKNAPFETILEHFKQRIRSNKNLAHLAAQYGKSKLLGFLVNQGINPFEFTEQGNAFHHALYTGQEEIVRSLLSYYKQVAPLLESHPLNTQRSFAGRLTKVPLEIALATNCSLDLIRLLLENGAHVTLVSNNVLDTISNSEIKSLLYTLKDLD